MYINPKTFSCHICQATEKEGFYAGEFEHNGVGHFQIGPAWCMNCGFIQHGALFDENVHLDDRQLRHLWELQIPPTHIWEYWLKDDEP
jgi:hypothetical protein